MSLAYAKSLVSELNSNEFIKSEIEGYSYVVKTSNYGGVKQRWLVVESKARKSADIKQLDKRISKTEATAEKKIKKLAGEEFACHQDALDCSIEAVSTIKIS